MVWSGLARTGGPTFGDCVVKFRRRMLVRPREEKGRLAFTLHLSAWYPNQHGLSLVNNSQEYHRSRAISERSTSTRHRLRWRGRGQPCPATTLSIMSCTGTIHMQMCSTTSKSHTFCSPVGNSYLPVASLGQYLTHAHCG